MGFPLGTEGYGGGWVYGLDQNRLSIGYVVGLDHHDAKARSRTRSSSSGSSIPRSRACSRAAKVLRYGAKTVPEGGYFAMPRLYGDGYVLVGDTRAS
jgi:electron-transferring-flavoprotein dehydrogenase